MKISITGNIYEGLSSELFNIFPKAEFFSRTTNYDLVNDKNDIRRFIKESQDSDVIILNASLYKFAGVMLLSELWKSCVEHNYSPYIICLGSTIDRVKNYNTSMYGLQKKTLREYCNSLSLIGKDGDENRPKVTYISFSTLSDKQDKHPDRQCIDLELAAQYIKWLIEQPKHICINEISIDAMQKSPWKLD